MADKSPEHVGGSTGPATDRHNDPVIDPTANVLQLVEAAVKRLDDMRNSEAKRIDDRMNDEVRHIRELSELRANYTQMLSEAEAKRIDAIRAVDVNAVAVAQERAVAQATVLANQVSQSAETLRALVAQTATTIAQQLEQSNRQSESRLALLEKAQYETAGRGAVANPAELLKEIQALRETRSANVASVDQTRNIGGYIAAGFGLLATVLGIIVTVMMLNRGGP